MKKAFLIMLLMPLWAWAQPAADSLKVMLSSGTLQGTQRIDALNGLAYQIRVSFPDSATAYVHEALRLSQDQTYAPGICDAYVVLGLLAWLEPAPEKGIEYGLRALQTGDAAHYKKGMMEANLLLGLVYTELDNKKAEDFTQRGLTLALDLNHAEGIARACNHLGNHYRRRNDGKEAMRFYEMGLRHLANRKDVSIKNLLLTNIALYYINRDEEREKTKLYLDEALQIAMSFKNKSAEMLTRTRMGMYYMNLNDFAHAEEQFKRSEKISLALGTRSALLENYTGLIDIKTKTGHIDEARIYLKKYFNLKDSLYGLENAREIAALETRHETEKKDQTIRLLEQEKRIQQIWRNVLMGGVVFALAIALLIYRLQRSRTQKTKQLLNIQQLLNDKLKEVDKFKTGFFANISHEFRTPLTLILAPLENELKKKQPAAGKKNLVLIRRNANRLLELVNQLLDLSKLESGKMELHIRAGELKQFLVAITESFESLAQYKQIEFVRDINLDDKAYWFDQDKTEKIVTNLVANAFKYTPAGGTVTLSATLVHHQHLSLVVTDTGTGIPHEEQEHVFSAFYQTKQAASQQQGTGLGLPLVKELVKLHNGTIVLQSEPGQGTTLTATIPVSKDSFPASVVVDDRDAFSPFHIGHQTIHPDSNATTTQSILHNKDSILVIEDNTDLREFMAATLQNNNYAVLTASDGEEALQIALKYVPSLVLSDLMMPRMDGMAFTKKMKDDERTSHIPVILLTAKNETQARIEGLKTGADDYLTKPFSPDELLVRIDNLISQRKKLALKFREKILVAPTPAPEASLDDKFLDKARTIVDTNLGDYTFTVEQMAEEMNLSRTQLLRKIKALTGLSPNDFIKDIRLKRAAEMIRQKVDIITQIGYAVGFNDQSYFTKCFKKQFGVTPTEYSMITSAPKIIS
ncbi:response regulator [Chryseolinea lacunae]|uniref:histidine kinase n=1 Tax=Chryseolinea lacunae TaxID=2801331 RepID=A0ABS1L1W7_9BACT|nr:response regulator [Chryseolinea lacunae]MBL0745565.1 response regulator [Chryseolinea lacunae]